MDGPAARPSGDLGDASLSAIRWMSGARLAAELAGVASTLVVARLVTPRQFGHAAVALIVVALAIGIANYAISAPLVQRRSIERAHVEASALSALVVGATLTLFVLLAAPVVVGTIFGPRVVALVQLASPAFLLAAAGSVPHALRSRALDFRRLGAIEAAAALAAAATASGLALAGINAESLVLGSLCGLAVSSVLLLVSEPLPLPRWHPAAVRDLAGFGVPAYAASLAYTVFQNVDYAIVAARLNATQAGFYCRAYQLSVLYQEKLSAIVLRVAFPIYSRSNNRDALRRLRLRMGRAQTMALYPFLVFLIAVAPELVPFLFGPQWGPAVVPTQILACTGMALVAVTGTTPLLWAAGRPRGLAVFNVATAGGYATLVFFVAPLGLTAVSVAVTCFSVVALCLQLALERAVGVAIREIWESFRPPLVASAVELAVAYPTARALSTTNLSDVLVIVCVGAVAGCVYAACIRVLFPAAWAESALLVRRLVGVGRRAHETRRLVALPRAAD
jgi:lipopolysaccharide exporter